MHSGSEVMATAKTEERTERLLCGHRPISFDVGEEALQLSFPDEMDLLLLRDNLVIASTAQSGRLAAGERFFGRDPKRYAELLQRCGAADGRMIAFPHIRGVALVSGALLAETDLALVFVIHGNTLRTRRVLRHCFSPAVEFVSLAALPEDGHGVGGLRRGDEALYRQLTELMHYSRVLLTGVGKEVHLADRSALLQLMASRLATAEHLRTPLQPPLTAQRLREDTSAFPFPCPGRVNIAHLTAVLLGLSLAVWETLGQGIGEAVWDDVHLYPCFALRATAQAQARLQQHPAVLEAARLALRYETVFSLDAGGEYIRMRIAPLTEQRSELYSLRAATPSL